jgi:hypothetical protein
MLRPTVSRPICLEIKIPSGTYDQIFITVRQLLVCWCGALSLMTGLLIYSRSGLIENTSVAQQWIYTNHIENTASSIVFTAPLHRNGSYPIVACVFVVTGLCLPSRCPATGRPVSTRVYTLTYIHTYILSGICECFSTYWVQRGLK